MLHIHLGNIIYLQCEKLIVFCGLLKINSIINVLFINIERQVAALIKGESELRK